MDFVHFSAYFAYIHNVICAKHRIRCCFYNPVQLLLRQKTVQASYGPFCAFLYARIAIRGINYYLRRLWFSILVLFAENGKLCGACGINKFRLGCASLRFWTPAEFS